MLGHIIKKYLELFVNSFNAELIFCNKEINIISISNQTEKVIIPFL